MPRPDEYTVEGYGVRTDGYDAPYHPSADFNPNVEFANGGDTKAAAKAQKERKDKRPSEFDSPRKREKLDSKLRETNVQREPVADESSDNTQPTKVVPGKPGDSGKKAASSTEAKKKSESKPAKKAASSGNKPAAKKTASPKRTMTPS